MPFCSSCGSNVRNHDAYCGKCGSPQPVSGRPAAGDSPRRAAGDFLGNIQPRTASMLCYIPLVGWLAAIVVLASARFRDDIRVRFDAFQGLYLFVAWLIVDSVLSPILRWPHAGPNVYRVIPAMMKAVVFGAWLFMIIKASQNERFKLPILGELAEKSVTEQRS